jgi:hypothetical protein
VPLIDVVLSLHTTEHDGGSTWGPAVWFGAVALGVSIFTLLRQELGRRKAEILVFFADSGEGRSDRVVIVNNGPATARNIEVVFNPPKATEIIDPADYPMPVFISVGSEPGAKVAALVSGYTAHIACFVLANTPSMIETTVSWDDRRLRRQVIDVSLSTTGVVL